MYRRTQSNYFDPPSQTDFEFMKINVLIRSIPGLINFQQKSIFLSKLHSTKYSSLMMSLQSTLTISFFLNFLNFNKLSSHPCEFYLTFPFTFTFRFGSLGLFVLHLQPKNTQEPNTQFLNFHNFTHAPGDVFQSHPPVHYPKCSFPFLCFSLYFCYLCVCLYIIGLILLIL